MQVFHQKSKVSLRIEVSPFFLFFPFADFHKYCINPNLYVVRPPKAGLCGPPHHSAPHVGMEHPTQESRHSYLKCFVRLMKECGIEVYKFLPLGRPQTHSKSCSGKCGLKEKNRSQISSFLLSLKYVALWMNYNSRIQAKCFPKKLDSWHLPKMRWSLVSVWKA